MNTAVIIQAAWTTETFSGEFADMMRLTYQRHAAYARSHLFDYWHIQGDCAPNYDRWKGGWDKVLLIQRALEQGYEYVAWLDADSAVTGDVDLREALPEGKLIGACEHWAEWFTKMDIPRHYNIGVSYYRNDPITRQFIADWLATYPSDLGRWLEQGQFNQLVKMPAYESSFHVCDARWNATVNVNMVDKPVVTGWHGIAPYVQRLNMMREALKDDIFKFRV